MRERKPRVEATSAVASDSSARTRRETARPRKEADKRGGPGADRCRRRASASRVRQLPRSQGRVALRVRASEATRTGRLFTYHPADGTVKVH